MQTPGERVLFVHAHPDDETIATGAAIAQLAASGGTPIVLTCTRGERGETMEPAAHLVAQAGSLAEHRVHELASALAELHAEGELLGGGDDDGDRLEDSGMRWGDDGRAIAAAEVGERALTAVPVEVLAARIGEVIGRNAVAAVVTCDADGGYGHPDHEHVHEATIVAARRFDVAVYVRTHEPADVAVDGGPVRETVRRALSRYGSQLRVEGDEIVHVGGQREQIPAVEHYRKMPEPASGRAWTGVVTGALVLAGALIGTVGTFTHQAIMPWGLVVALVAAIGLIVGARLAAGRAPAIGAAVGVLGAIILFALDPLGAASGTANAIIPANPAGWIWSLAPAAAAFVTLAWPDAASLARIRLAAREGA